MKPTNLLFIISDQHSYDAMGAYGNSLVQTPNLDRLAERGTRFTNAYTNCPICVPVRAALATGRYVHQGGYWDNGHPYDGAVPGWHHHLRGLGFQIDSIGKLHFRSMEDDLGFTDSIEPLNVVAGMGDILSCIRDNPPLRQKRGGILDAGPGDSTYLQYDIRNADNGERWLAQHANDEKPWALFLSFVCPHPPASLLGLALHRDVWRGVCSGCRAHRYPPAPGVPQHRLGAGECGRERPRGGQYHSR